MAIVESSNFLYLNVSGGFLKNKQKNIAARGYEGTLIGIQEKQEEFEGKKIAKVELKMKDAAGEIAIIKFTKAGWFSAGFFSRISKVDISKSFVLGCSQSDKNEKISFCWIKQGDAIPADKVNFPKPKDVVINNEKTKDWTDMLNVIPGIIENILKKIPNAIGAVNTSVAAENESDDLPF